MVIPCILRTNLSSSQIMIWWCQEIFILRVPFSPCISNADITAHTGSPHYLYHQRWFLKYLVSLICLVSVSAKPRLSHYVTELVGCKVWWVFKSRILHYSELHRQFTIQNYALQSYSPGISLPLNSFKTFYTLGLGTF